MQRPAHMPKLLLYCFLLLFLPIHGHKPFQTGWAGWRNSRLIQQSRDQVIEASHHQCFWSGGDCHSYLQTIVSNLQILKFQSSSLKHRKTTTFLGILFAGWYTPEYWFLPLGESWLRWREAVAICESHLVLRVINKFRQKRVKKE